MKTLVLVLILNLLNLYITGFFATYDYIQSHDFEQTEAACTAAIWPVFWVFMAGN